MTHICCILNISFYSDSESDADFSDPVESDDDEFTVKKPEKKKKATEEKTAKKEQPKDKPKEEKQPSKPSKTKPHLTGT